MSDRYTHRNLLEVEDSAQKFGMGESHESRFSTEDLGAEQSGFSLHRIKPGKRQPFGHRHDDVEEMYIVIAGAGRAKLDDEIVELKPLDALRVSPGVIRAWEAGDDGLDILAFSPRRTDDRGEIIADWWTD